VPSALSGNRNGARNSSSAAVIRRLLLHDLGGLRLEVLPEGFEHRLPLLAPAADLVEAVLEPGSEVVET
jgi:hypothetical protein